MYPLRMLIVFMHEIAHGIAAVITGGSILAISLSVYEGGHAITQGGNLFLIFSAGYLGSLLLGVFLFLMALKTDLDRWTLAGFGVVTLFFTAFYIRDLFPIWFCGLTGIAMIAAGYWLRHTVTDFILRVIGLVSMIYVPYDIFSDTIARSHLRSDAFMLAERFGGTTVFWGGLWLLISFAVIFGCLRSIGGANSNLGFSRP